MHSYDECGIFVFTMTNTTQLATLGVLAGAYLKRNPKSLLTHAVALDANGYTAGALCKRVEADNLADLYSAGDDERAAPPTCPVCAKRDPRFR